MLLSRHEPCSAAVRPVQTIASNPVNSCRSSVVTRIAASVLTFIAGAAAMFAYVHLPRATPLGDPSSASQTTQVRAPHNLASTAVPEDFDSLDTQSADVTTSKSPETIPETEVPSSTWTRVDGVTEPAPGRFAKLPLATSQPVAFVDVKPGDRVKKGWQVFSHWESPERLQAMKNELEKSKKLLQIAKSRAESANQSLERLTKLQSSVSAQESQDGKTNASIRQSEVEAAELAVMEAENRFIAMDFEFKQAFVTSPIDGIVATVDVFQGERRQVGGGFRGVIVLDPRVLACRCLLTAEQVYELRSVTQSPTQNLTAKVQLDGKEWAAKVTSCGVLAESSTGLIPVLLEVQNPDETLLCGVRFHVQLDVPPST